MSLIESNSTKLLLAPNDVFTGKAVKPDVKYITIQITASLKGGNSGLLEIYYSLDGIYYDTFGDSWTFTNETNEAHIFKETQMKGSYFYVKWTNNGISPYTSFNLNTKLTTTTSTVSVDGVINIPEVNVNIDGETVFARLRDANNNDINSYDGNLNVFDSNSNSLLNSLNNKTPSGLTVYNNKLLCDISGSTVLTDISGQHLVVNTISGFALDATVGTTNSKLDTLNTTVNDKHLFFTNDSVTIGDISSGVQVGINNFPSTQSVSGSVSVSNFPATQPVSGTFWQATQPVSGSVSVSNLPTTQAVSGSVSVSNFPATQPVSGSVSVSNTVPIPVSGSVSVSNFPTSTQVSNFPTTQAISGSVSVSNLPATQPVSGTFWQATQPVSGSVSVSNLPTTQDVSGSVSVSNFPSTQPVSGSVSVSNLPTVQDVSGSVTVSNFPATQAVSGTFWQATQPVSGSVSVSNLPTTQDVSGSVSVSNFPATQAVSGTFWQATQPVSGSVSVSNLPTTQAVSGSVSVSNFPATQAVSGTFWQTTQPVSGSVSVSNLPSVQDVSGNVNVTNTSLDTHMYASSNGSTWHHLASDSNGQLNVHAKAQDGAGNDLTSKLIASSQALDVNIVNTVDPIIIDFANPTIDITGAVTVSNFPVTQGINGDVNITNTSIAVSGSVNANITNTSLPVTGTFYQATQPVSLASNVGIKDSSGNSIKADASGNLNVNIASGTVTVSSVNIKDSSGNSIKADASGNLNTAMQAYNRTGAIVSNLTTVQPVGASSSVKALETYSYMNALTNDTNIPLQLTLTTGASTNSLDCQIQNGSTQNTYGKTGINFYQVTPDTKSYTVGGYDANGTFGNCMIVGNSTANISVSTYNFGVANSRTYYAVLTNATSRTLYYDYVDASGNLISNASVAINNSTATSLGTFVSLVDFRLGSGFTASADSLHIGLSSTVATLKSTSLYYEDLNQKCIGVFTVPNGYIGFITSLSSLVATSSGLQMNRWTDSGSRSSIWRINNTGNVIASAGYNGVLGELLTAGQSVAFSSQSAVAGKSVIANITLQKI